LIVTPRCVKKKSNRAYDVYRSKSFGSRLRVLKLTDTNTFSLPSDSLLLIFERKCNFLHHFPHLFIIRSRAMKWQGPIVSAEIMIIIQKTNCLFEAFILLKKLYNFAQNWEKKKKYIRQNPTLCMRVSRPKATWLWLGRAHLQSPKCLKVAPLTVGHWLIIWIISLMLTLSFWQNLKVLIFPFLKKPISCWIAQLFYFEINI